MICREASSDWLRHHPHLRFHITPAMNIRFIDIDELDSLCAQGMFYSKDDPSEEAALKRETAIEDLASEMDEIEGVLVSDFVNTNRLIFVDLEHEAFNTTTLKKLASWVANDPECHAIRCLVYHGQSPIGSFLITNKEILFDLAFRATTWLRAL
jgi:hypothetical protein